MLRWMSCKEWLQSNTPRDTKWMESDTIPHNVATDTCFKLNEQQLIFASTNTDKDAWDGLYVYQLHLGEFKQFIQYPRNVDVTEYCLVFDSTKNRLYGTGAWRESMFIIDMNNGNEFISVRWNQKPQIGSQRHEGTCGTLLNVNGEIHLIGGYKSSKHLVWNDKTNTFLKIYDFGTDLFWVNLSLVYIPTKGIIIFILGDPNHDDKNFVWEYVSKTRKWRKVMNLPFCHNKQSSFLTSNERYIIMSSAFGGQIYGLDVENYKLYQSEIETPWDEAHFFIKTGGLKDQLLIVGWIRYMFKYYDFGHLKEAPIDLMMLIASYYSQEVIHWIGKHSERHLTIDIRHILSSLKEN